MSTVPSPTIDSLPTKQCQAWNKRTSQRCQNIVLMEFLGPIPDFCAQHIEQDPLSLFSHCKFGSPHNDRRRRCREIVLRDFGWCTKHFDRFLENYNAHSHLPLLQDKLNIVQSHLRELEESHKAPVKDDKSLYHRKYKIITKLQQMKIRLLHRLSKLERLQPNQSIPIQQSPFTQLSHCLSEVDETTILSPREDCACDHDHNEDEDLKKQKESATKRKREDLNEETEERDSKRKESPVVWSVSHIDSSPIDPSKFPDNWGFLLFQELGDHLMIW
eukprot:TRINITY_DN330_c0_g5_i1.p1 TRINITY_DN330_c0_g5~~TRINITY_DN330_c0_g5_i1.p1  ORF type:complete len:315 (-),score=62.00 TRINITY_DN330_c0_g5_i1:64-885(-)